MFPTTNSLAVDLYLTALEGLSTNVENCVAEVEKERSGKHWYDTVASLNSAPLWYAMDPIRFPPQIQP